MISTNKETIAEQDTQPFFKENITHSPQNTTIPITSGTCDEPKMQKTTSTAILSTAKECDQLIPVSLTDDNCPDPKSWLHPQDPGKKSDTLKAIAINKETSAEQDTHPFIKENATHSLNSTTISINSGTNTGHLAQKTFRTRLLAQVLDRSHNS